MKKVRCYLAAIALVVTLSGPLILGLGSISLANAASSQHVRITSAAGQSTRSVAFKPLGPCPMGGSMDC